MTFQDYYDVIINIWIRYFNILDRVVFGFGEKIQNKFLVSKIVNNSMHESIAGELNLTNRISRRREKERIKYEIVKKKLKTRSKEKVRKINEAVREGCILH